MISNLSVVCIPRYVPILFLSFDEDGEFEDFDIEPYSVPPELSDMMRAQEESAGAISSD